MEEIIKIAMVDDHVLLRNALASLINSFHNCQVVCEANNGSDLMAKMSKLTPQLTPQVILLDLNMPVMDGFDTAIWLRDNRPEMHVLMLTMYDSELTLIRLL